MKKEIVTMLLAATLMTSSLTACTNVAVAENDINNLTEASSQISTQSIPTNEYNTIIDMYREIIEAHKNPTENSKENNDRFSQKWYWDIYCTTLIGNVSNNSYGYAFCDLNSDNQSELFLLLDDYTILAIFSMVDGVPFMLSDFHSRKTCWIDKNKTIHISGSNGASDWAYSEHKLSSDGTELELLFEYGSENYDNTNAKSTYYVISKSDKVYIDDQQFVELCISKPYSSLSEAAEKTKQKANLAFISLNN